MKILAISGSTRAASSNNAIPKRIAEHFANAIASDRSRWWWWWWWCSSFIIR